MEHAFVTLVELMVLPPGLFLLLVGTGVVMIRRKPIVGKSLILSGLAVCYLLSTPLVAGFLMARVETYPALTAASLDASTAGAIVVLSSEREKNAEEYDGDTVGPNSLIRCRYGAFLQRRTGLPILVSGGVLGGGEQSLAQMMAKTLISDFGAGEVWLEDRSRTTRENAVFSADFLQQKGIDTIYLVTQAWHMPRAVAVFEEAGLVVIPAPTAFRGDANGEGRFRLDAMLPTTRSLNRSYNALHEIFGVLWYDLRY